MSCRRILPQIDSFALTTPWAWRRVGRAAATALALALLTGQALGTEYHVATTGSDSNDGTQAAPFASLSKANSAAAAGDTIWVHAGTYFLTTQLVLSKSGSSDTNRTKVFAYPGEKPVLDASKYVTSNPAVDVPVVLVTGSFMHLKGLEIGNAKVGASGDHSYSLVRTKNASNDTFELLDLHHGFGSGLFVDTGQGGNLILNSDSHDNYDKDGSQGDGQNADGFGVHYQTTGPSTIIRGCRAWNNSDDGYDFISQEVPITIENSFASANGHGSGGNGNGFKIGSSQTGVRHIVQNNVAWGNKAAGFYANHSSGGNTWLNNSSYSNGTQYNMLASPAGDSSSTIILSGSLVHRMYNNVGYPNKNSNMGGVESANNSWDLSISEASAAFVSTMDTNCNGPRESDGSMPAACTFLHLKSTSALIDKGKDVGLPFTGAAPDLGAYEFGATAGAGGSSAGGSSAGGSSAGGSSAGGSSAGGPSGAGTAGMGGPSTGGSGAASGGASSSGSGAPGSSGAPSSTTGGSAPQGLAGGASGTDGLQPSSAETGGCGCSIPSRSRAPLGEACWLLAGLASARKRWRQKRAARR
jgi:hypothetical protein